MAKRRSKNLKSKQPGRDRHYSSSDEAKSPQREQSRKPLTREEKEELELMKECMFGAYAPELTPELERQLLKHGEWVMRAVRPVYVPSCDTPASIRYEQTREKYPRFVDELAGRISVREDFASCEDFCHHLSGDCAEEVLLVMQLLDNGFKPDLIAPEDLEPTPHPCVDPNSGFEVGFRARPCLRNREMVYFLHVTMATPRQHTVDVLRWTENGWSYADFVSPGRAGVFHLDRVLSLGFPFQRWRSEDLMEHDFHRRMG